MAQNEILRSWSTCQRQCKHGKEDCSQRSAINFKQKLNVQKQALKDKNSEENAKKQCAGTSTNATSRRIAPLARPGHSRRPKAATTVDDENAHIEDEEMELNDDAIVQTQIDTEAAMAQLQAIGEQLRQLMEGQQAIIQTMVSKETLQQ